MVKTDYYATLPGCSIMGHTFSIMLAIGTGYANSFPVNLVNPPAFPNYRIYIGYRF